MAEPRACHRHRQGGPPTTPPSLPNQTSEDVMRLRLGPASQRYLRIPDRVVRTATGPRLQKQQAARGGRCGAGRLCRSIECPRSATSPRRGRSAAGGQGLIHGQQGNAGTRRGQGQLRARIAGGISRGTWASAITTIRSRGVKSIASVKMLCRLGWPSVRPVNPAFDVRRQEKEMRGVPRRIDARRMGPL